MHDTTENPRSRNTFAWTIAGAVDAVILAIVLVGVPNNCGPGYGLTALLLLAMMTWGVLLLMVGAVGAGAGVVAANLRSCGSGWYALASVVIAVVLLAVDAVLPHAAQGVIGCRIDL